MPYSNFLLARDVERERRELERKQREAEEQNRRAGLGSSVGKLLGGYALPALFAATGVGAPLAVVAGLGSYGGSKLGELFGGGYAEGDFGTGKFLTPQREELGESYGDYRRSAHQAQALGAAVDAGLMALGGSEGMIDWAKDLPEESFWGKAQRRGSQSLWDFFQNYFRE